MKILISGSLAYDRIMNFPGKFSDHILPEKIHVLNVSFLVDGLQERFGGTAGNIAYGLALLGEKPLILAAAGKDFDDYGKWLTSLGLSLDGVRIISDELTAGAYITTDHSDNQITGFNPGAMKFPCSYSFDGTSSEDTMAIISPGNVEDMKVFSKFYKERKIPYIFDPGQQIPALQAEDMKDMITGSMMLISNDYELEMIMRATELDLPEILRRTESVVTTLGDEGALLRDNDGEKRIPVVPAEDVLDPTGAGDSFRAGLLKGIIEEKSLEESAMMGAVCASFSVQCQGTQCHRFTEDDFKDRFKQCFNRAPY
jgi:adenosine kinase